MNDLDHLFGCYVADNGELQEVGAIVGELEAFANEFSTHAMSDYQLYLSGKRDAYMNVVKYLKRVDVKFYPEDNSNVD